MLLTNTCPFVFCSQLENLEEGVRAAFTYYFYNPNDTMITNSIDYYRKKLDLKADEFVSTEPGLSPHQVAYKTGRVAYENQEWLKSVEFMETAVDLYLKDLDECLLRCDDTLAVNMSKHVSVEKATLLSDHYITLDSMEYYQLLLFQINRLLECRAQCRVRMDTLNGKYYDKYLPGHFNHLQFSYFKCELEPVDFLSASICRICFIFCTMIGKPFGVG